MTSLMLFWSMLMENLPSVMRGSALTGRGLAPLRGFAAP
jgi:hypothetical protein